MSSDFEVIVVGLGAMGSASVYQLAKRGARVLGIDRLQPPHSLGSTHGETRITRLAIGEGAIYTPLVLRSHQIWRELEREASCSLLSETGGLILSGPRSSKNGRAFFETTIKCARRYAIEHELLDTAEIRRRYPQFVIDDDEDGYYEFGAGYVRPEACIRAQLEIATSLGAELHMHERVLSYRDEKGRVVVETDRATYTADRMILTAGPWLPELLQGWDLPLRIFRQVLFWFAVDPLGDFQADRFPVFIRYLKGDLELYGFPSIDDVPGTIKIASSQYLATTMPDTVYREVSPSEWETMYRDKVEPYFRGVTPDCLRAVACLYTVTPDGDFLLDRDPRSERVLIASPCSGHGFKHSAAIGEQLAEWSLTGRASADLGSFSAKRFEGLGQVP